jgi:hypothetical protein
MSNNIITVKLDLSNLTRALSADLNAAAGNAAFAVAMPGAGKWST